VLWEQGPFSCTDTLLTKKLNQILTLKKKRKLFISNSINLLITKKAFSPLWYFVSIEEYKFSLYSRDLKMIMAKYMSSDPCFRERKKLQNFKLEMNFGIS